MNLFEQQRTKMYWLSVGKKPQQLKELSIPHMNNILDVLKKTNNKNMNGYPIETWKKVINEEIEYRNKLGSKVINLFPVLKTAVVNQLKVVK